MNNYNKSRHLSVQRILTCRQYLDLDHTVRPSWFSPIQISITKPRLEGQIVWFLCVQWLLALVTATGYREHDQDGGSMIKVCRHIRRPESCHRRGSKCQESTQARAFTRFLDIGAHEQSHDCCRRLCLFKWSYTFGLCNHNFAVFYEMVDISHQSKLCTFHVKRWWSFEHIAPNLQRLCWRRARFRHWNTQSEMRYA